MRHDDGKYDINVYCGSADEFYKLFTQKNIMLKINIIIYKLHTIMQEKSSQASYWQIWNLVW